MTIIGGRRPEEARIYDEYEGYHRFHDEEAVEYGSFEIFWHDGETPIGIDRDEEPDWEEWTNANKAGWYWHACFPGCMPDGDPNGPFGSSRAAREDADEYWAD